MYEIELAAGRATWFPPEYVEVFHLSERLRTAPQALAPEFGLPTLTWWWIEAARVMSRAESLYQDAQQAKVGTQ